MDSINRPDRKVCVIGLDGVNKKILKLIGFEINKKNTVYSDLISTIPPYTPPAWTSILSGVNPGKHGVYGFYKITDNKLNLTNSFDVKCLRLFEMLDLNKLKSVIINAPMTHPFTGIRSLKNTVIVTDWASPVQTIYPDYLQNKYKNFLIEPPNWNPETGRIFDYSEEYLEKVYEYLDARLNLYYELLENIDWNLFFIVFSETDWLLHRIPDLLEGEKVDEVKPIFNKLHDFFKKASKVSDLVFIVSDHGFEIKTQKISINTVLLQNGLLELDYKLKKEENKKTRWLNQANENPPQENIFNRVLKSTAKYFPKKFIKPLINHFSGKLPIRTEIDFKSDGFIYEPSTWRVTVNKNKNKIREVLSELQGIKKVESVSNIYDFPDNTKDLILIPKNEVIFDMNYKEKVYSKIYETNHEMHGIFLATGDIISNSCKTEKLSVYDVTPTILFYFDLPIPQNIDGRILKEIFTVNSTLSERKPKYVSPSYYDTNIEKEKLKRKIKRLKL